MDDMLHFGLGSGMGGMKYVMKHSSTVVTSRINEGFEITHDKSQTPAPTVTRNSRINEGLDSTQEKSHTPAPTVERHSHINAGL